MAHLRDFRRGFICTERGHRFVDPGPLSGWNRVLTSRYKIFIHPEADVVRSEDAEGRLVVAIGDIFSTSGSANIPELLLKIAGGDRRSLDDLSGRYALIVIDGESATVLHDPLGSQSVFYTLGGPSIAASHSTLIAECEGIELSPRLQEYVRTDEYRNRSSRFLPGDITLYDNIVHLIPNNEVELSSGTTARYWPWRRVRAANFSDLISEWQNYFEAYAAFLQGRYAPVIGLTGGVDSRAVIATLQSLNVGSRFVTWDRMGEEESARIPRLVEHLGGTHRWIRTSAKPGAPDLDESRRAAQRATGYTRGMPLLPAQMAEGAGPRDVFLKGLGGEVMCGPFNARNKTYLPDDPVKLAYALFAGPARVGASKAYAETTVGAIRDYLSRANYSADLHGVDVGDLIYWEQRMGTWTSIQHAEMSTAMNSHSAMNSRRLFAAAWGLPDDERFSKELMLRIMREYDPVLASL